MNRFTTMALAAGTLALATASVAQAEMVEFSHTWYGYAPGNIDVTEWGMSHISDVTVSYATGAIANGPLLQFMLDIGGQQFPVEITGSSELTFDPNENEAFHMTATIENVPNHGPMQISITGDGTYENNSYWQGIAEITWGPQYPFGAPVTQSGVWTAQIVPAPGVIALFGLAGLSGRRRRD